MKKLGTIISICILISLLVSSIITTGTIINNYTGGGTLWKHNGTTIVLNTTSDNVNIGENATTGYKLNVKGTSNFSETIRGNNLHLFNDDLRFSKTGIVIGLRCFLPFGITSDYDLGLYGGSSIIIQSSSINNWGNVNIIDAVGDKSLGNLNVDSDTNIDGDLYVAGNLTGNSLIALGEGAVSSGAGSIAIGRYSTANGVESITFGSNSWAENRGSLSMGFGSNTFGDYSLAINGGYTEGLRSIAIGQSETYGNYSLSVGQNNIVTGIQSQCFGLNNGVAGNYGFVAGNGNYLDTVAEYSGIIGVFNEAWGIGSYIMGTNSYTLGGNSYSMGNSNFVDTTGSNSMCLGDSNYVTSPNSYAFGGGNQITGNDSLALGSGIIINGKNSIGINSNFLDTLVINRDSLFGVGCDADFYKNVNVSGYINANSYKADGFTGLNYNITVCTAITPPTYKTMRFVHGLLVSVT